MSGYGRVRERGRERVTRKECTRPERNPRAQGSKDGVLKENV